MKIICDTSDMSTVPASFGTGVDYWKPYFDFKNQAYKNTVYLYLPAKYKILEIKQTKPSGIDCGGQNSVTITVIDDLICDFSKTPATIETPVYGNGQEMLDVYVEYRDSSNGKVIRGHSKSQVPTLRN